MAVQAETCPAPTLDRATKALLICSGIPGGLAFMAIAAVLPKMQEALAHSSTEQMLVKQLIGVVGFAMMFGAPIAWPLVRRFGLRMVMIVASILFVVAGTTGLYLDSLNALLPFRLVVGLTAAVFQVAAFTYINTALTGNDRAKYLGWHISTAMGSTILLHPIAGALGHTSWRGPFALYFLGIIVAVLAFFMNDYRGEADAPPQQRQSLSETLRWFPFRFLLLGLIVGLCAFAPSIYTPFMSKALGFGDPSQIARIMMATSIIGAGMALLYGKARERLSGVQALVFSFSCCGVGSLLAVQATGFTSLLIGMCVYSFGVGWGVPNLMNVLSTQVSAENQPTATGWVKSIHYLSAPFAPIVVERMARSYGPASAMWMVAAFSLFVVVWVLSMRNQWNAS